MKLASTGYLSQDAWPRVAAAFLPYKYSCHEDVVVTGGRMDNLRNIRITFCFVHFPIMTGLALILFMFAPALLAANTNYQSPLSVDGSTTISLEQARAMFDAGEVFIDVRNPRLFKRKHIPGSYHLDLKNGFEKAALEKIVRKDQPVVIYSSGVNCARGYRAVALAVSWGFTRVQYYRGGIIEWRDANYPFVYAGAKQ